MEKQRDRKRKRELRKMAFQKSIPILCSYIFVAMAYGMMMQEAGLGWPFSLFVSMTVYTGAFQFVLITFLSGGASLLTVAVTAFLMNSRQTFYSLSFVRRFQGMGWRKWYMVHTMTDETYAVNCSLELPGKDGQEVMFYVAFLSRIYWMAGAVLGGVLGQLVPFGLEGIDFCMTALFVIIFMDQWEKADSHKAALIGLGVGLFCLLAFGQRNFMLPALCLVSGILMVGQKNSRKG